MTQQLENYKYAIYGGTFDPIHLAHIKLAEYAIKELDLDELIFMPAYINPFKQNRITSSPQDRLSMIQKILSYNDKFSVSDFEIHKKDVSYTIDTLEHFENIKKGKLYFVLGYDTIINLNNWHRGEEILSKYPIITAFRPGISKEKASLIIDSFRKDYSANIYVVDMPPLDVSATHIRELIKENKSLSGQVLPEIEEYILEHQLYK